jgi:hypothetical protein
MCIQVRAESTKRTKISPRTLRKLCELRDCLCVLCLCHASSFNDGEEGQAFGALATLYRRSCQTTLRCCIRKEVVVNGQRKAFVKEAGKYLGDERK